MPNSTLRSSRSSLALHSPRSPRSPRHRPTGFSAWAAALCLLLITACTATDQPTASSTIYDAQPAGLQQIQADAAQVRLRFANQGPWETDSANAGSSPPVILLAQHRYQSGLQGLELYRGPIDHGQTLSFDRHQSGRDLLLQRFVLINAQTRQPIGAPRWVTDIQGQPETQPVHWPQEIKGVSCPVDFDDLTTLGVKHVHYNIDLNKVMAHQQPLTLATDQAGDDQPEHSVRVGQWRVPMNPAAVRELDRDLRGLTERGINTVAVILAYVPASGPTQLSHQNADIENAPHGLTGINLDDHEGLTRYVGTLKFLSRRYSLPGAPHGQIGGWIIGNEVDSHWGYHNLGQVPFEFVVKQYADELRLAQLAIASQQADPRVYLSLTHSWAEPNSKDALRSLSARDLMLAINDYHKAEGDVPWDVAYHPYPQSLFEPRFWNDATAMYGFDSPMITYKNIELLPAYLKRESLRFRGEPRRVILSEQGLHSPKGEDGEMIQAAAYAASYARIKAAGGIDAYILHRHVDHQKEGGLRLGLWSADPNPPADAAEPASYPLHKKQAWHAFYAAGTPQQDQAFAAYIQYLGEETWRRAAVPQPGPFPETAPEWATIRPAGDVVFDLVDRIDDAQRLDVLDLQQKLLNLPDAGTKPALYVHPSVKENKPAVLRYALRLPPGDHLTLHLSTQDRGDEGGDGLRFRVAVNGNTLLDHEDDPMVIRAHTLDLTPYAGQEIQLDLIVDPKANASYDWAHWIQPYITKS